MWIEPVLKPVALNTSVLFPILIAMVSYNFIYVLFVTSEFKNCLYLEKYKH